MAASGAHSSGADVDRASRLSMSTDLADGDSFPMLEPVSEMSIWGNVFVVGTSQSSVEEAVRQPQLQFIGRFTLE